MLDYIGARGFAAMNTAVSLGIFDVLESPKSAGQVAGEIDGDPRGVALLLDALVALGYLKKSRDGYALSRMTRKWLPLITDGRRLFVDTVEYWKHAGESIRNGGGKPMIGTDSEEDQRAFQRSMGAFARVFADRAARRIPLPGGARELLDVGGGHALYSIALCRRRPGLHATVFDVPHAISSGRHNARAAGVGDRISFIGGDFRADELMGNYDAALLFNVIHIYASEENKSLIQKIANSLSPGGIIAVLDQIPGRFDGPIARATVRLQGFEEYNWAGGGIYTYPEIKEWLASAGFVKPRRRGFRRWQGNTLIVARKKE